MRISGNAKDSQINLPSFLQWLKTLPSDTPKLHKVVKVVWFPNKFPNFTVDTESFRLRLSPEQFDEPELTDLFETSISRKAVLCVVVDPAEKGAWAIEELEDEVGVWEEVGTYGYKCSVADKPKSEPKRVPRKPVAE